MKVLYLSNGYVYIEEDGRVVRKELSYEKGTVTSSVGYKNILNITFKLSKSIEKEMLEVEAEKYIFTEGSLDYNKEYKINYVFKEYDDYYNVEAFAIEVESLKKEFSQYLRVYKYIDFISFKPFVFKSYYEVIDQKPKNDAFIYFNEEEAFLSCFEEGEFVFVKSITKLSTLAKELDLSLEKTVELLSQKGLDEKNYEDAGIYSTVDSFFSQFFMKVNNLINYSVSYYGLKKIERIFFYSDFEIKNLIDNYSNFWNLSGIEFKKLEIQSEYDPFDYTALIYNSKHFENEEENFTVFSKPTPFYKTKSGMFIIFAVLVFLGVGTDALCRYFKLSEQQKKIEIMKTKNSRIEREKRIVLSAIKIYKKKIAEIKKQNSAIRNEIDDIGNKINYLSYIQKQPKVSNELADIANELKKYNLKISFFNKQNSHIQLYIVSKFDNSSAVAEFMQDLYKKGYKNITSTEINNNLGIYISKVSYDE